MNGLKRLTPQQSRKVNALVKKSCCNYDNGNWRVNNEPCKCQ